MNMTHKTARNFIHLFKRLRFLAMYVDNSAFRSYKISNNSSNEKKAWLSKTGKIIIIMLQLLTVIAIRRTRVGLTVYGQGHWFTSLI